ncbi:MAG: PIN domain-containing protein [Candidatus Bathyarchaeia archaeon]
MRSRGLKVVLDTWIFLDLSEPSKALLNQARLRNLEGLVSTVTFAELYSLLYKRVNEKEIERFRRSMERLNLRDVPVTRDIAEEGGRYKAKYGFSIADGIILATAVMEHAKILVTGDPDFERVMEVKVANPEEAMEALRSKGEG